MVEIELHEWQGNPETAVLEVADTHGLSVVSDGGLKSYPGSRHWHLKKGKSAGTLEVTWWPAGNRLWVSYHANRVGDGWVEEVAPRFAECLAGLLGGSVELPVMPA